MSQNLCVEFEELFWTKTPRLGSLSNMKSSLTSATSAVWYLMMRKSVKNGLLGKVQFFKQSRNMEHGCELFLSIQGSPLTRQCQVLVIGLEVQPHRLLETRIGQRRSHHR